MLSAAPWHDQQSVVELLPNGVIHLQDTGSSLVWPATYTYASVLDLEVETPASVPPGGILW
jgi:hypothetical protein